MEGSKVEVMKELLLHTERMHIYKAVKFPLETSQKA
jgi:hypothetical protein